MSPAKARAGTRGLGDAAALFGFSAEQLLFRDTVVEFARDELAPASSEPEAPFSRELWRRCGALGIHGLAVPEEHGGGDASPSTIVLALEALGYGCRNNGLLFSLNAQLWACTEPLLRFGSDEQKRRYLPGICDGTIVAAHAMSEPDSGSDAFALATRAEEVAGGFRLSGSKTFVTNGPEADVFILFARTGAGGFGGISAFAIDRDTPGLSVGSPIRKMGLAGSPMCEVFLDGCEVRHEHVLGRRGGGMAVFTASMRLERSCILASAVGSMQHQLESSLSYAQSRRQFGESIGSFQTVANRLVDMRMRVETARLMLYRLARLLDDGGPVDAEAALTKLHISEAYVASSLDAIRIHGGYGYLSEYGIERELRDAIGSTLYSGTSDIQRNIVARALGLGGRAHHARADGGHG